MNGWTFAQNRQLQKVTIKARNFSEFGPSAFIQNNNLRQMICLSLTPPTFSSIAPLSSNTFSNMTLYVPYGTVGIYQATDAWSYYIGVGMRIEELVYDIADNIYVKIEGYSGSNNPYIVDPTNPSWGINYVGTLVESGEYAGYYSFNGIVGVTDYKPLEIRDGSISGTKIADITLKYDETVYDVNYVLGMSTLQTNSKRGGSMLLSASDNTQDVVSQAEYDRLKCEVNSLKIKLDKLLKI